MQGKHGWAIRDLERYITQLLEWSRLLDSREMVLDDALTEFDEDSHFMEDSFERVRTLPQSQHADTAIVAYCLTAARFHLLRLMPQQRQELYETGLKSATRIGAKDQLSQLYQLLGTAHDSQHQFRQAQHCYETSLSIVGDHTEPQRQIEMIGSLGSIAYRLNDIERALRLQFDALSRATRYVPSMRSKLLCGIGLSYKRQENWDKAIEYLQKAAVEAVGIDDESYALGSLATAYRRIGNVEQAETTLLRRLQLAESVGDIRALRNSLGNLGNVHADAGRFDDAMACHERALSLSRQMHDLGGEATDLHNIGSTLEHMGERLRAISYYARAADLFGRVGDGLREGIAVKNIAFVHGGDEHVSEAISIGQQAIAAYSGAPNTADGVNAMEKSIAKCKVKMNKGEDV